MSSDSDSDICDFTSSIEKQMSKGLNQFWHDFDKVIDEKTKSDDTSYIVDKENSNASENATEEKKILNTIYAGSSTSKQCKDESHNDILNVAKESDVQTRITNKLNKLSAEIQTILQDKRNKPKRGTKRRSSKRLQPTRTNARRIINLPVLNVDNSVVLSSDDETQVMQKFVNLDEEELNPIVTVNVLWKSVEKNSFKVYKYQALNCIPEHYSEKFHINSKLLFFTLNDKPIILEENSFVSLRLDDSNQIEGGVLPEQYLNNSQQFTTLQEIEPLKFKVQCNDRKKTTIGVSCRENDKMEIIFWQVSRHIEQSVDNIKIYFDGNVIRPSNKICEMDLEDGDCFDLVITNVPVNT